MIKSVLPVAEKMSFESDILIEIPQGKLRGLKEETPLGNVFYSFQRIPYAKPPVGPLRFKDPEPADGWKGVRDGTQMGATAPSVDIFTQQYSITGDEDCLFANVYTRELPGRSSKKYPVMVWIHGGAFTSGSGNKDLYGPEMFMHHDVILVTFNYRLGVLGFLTLESDICPGNFGLKDQRLLLRWVQENISHFGGDKDNVTIFGESAGAASVHYQILSPTTKGLFKRGIAQSGSALCFWAWSSRAKECAFTLGRRLGCHTTDENVLLEFLRKAPVEDITLQSVDILRELEGGRVRPGEYLINISFRPTVEPESEGAFITQEPLRIVQKGLHQDVPFLTGSNTKEIIGIGVKDTQDFVDWTTDEQFQDIIPRELNVEKGSEQALAIAKTLREYYYKNGSSLDAYINLLSDSCINRGVYQSAKANVTNKGRKAPTYLYSFSYEGERNVLKNLFKFDIPGTAHADELGYQFNTNMAPLPPIVPGTPDYDFSLKFTNMWVNFATTGCPDPKWFPTDESFSYLDIGKKIEMRENYMNMKDRGAVWEEVFRIANM